MKAMGLIPQEIYRRVDLERVNICYMVDASGVMIGSRIGTVNSSVEECTPMYKEIEKETGVTCYFRVMKYSTVVTLLLIEHFIEHYRTLLRAIGYKVFDK